MCGITGIIDPNAASGASLEASLRMMLRALILRGPDDEGTAFISPRAGGTVALGSRRLAILDLSPAGHQPMLDPASGNVLAFNGEIFNFRELRPELTAAGWQFRSDCDTEVLLAGYSLWGESFIQRLRGMFAFAIWDAPRQSLLIVRDRLGIKPVYFAESNGRFAFASELRALLASGLIRPQLDATGLDSYLRFGAVQEPSTLVRGIRLLPAGHLLRWREGHFTTERYWSLPHTTNTTNGTNGARRRRLEELNELLTQAVRMRLISDVPLGIFLSGGLDSTVVAAVASTQQAVHTFNVTFSEKRFAEGEKARSVAALLGCEHHEITLSEAGLLSSLPDALAAMDQPTVDGINTYFVSRAAKQSGVTVALSGLGGDELFGGYRSFRIVPRMERIDRWVPFWARNVAAGIADMDLLGGRSRPKLAMWLRGRHGFGHPFFLSRLILQPSLVARLLQPGVLLDVDYSSYETEYTELAELLAAHDPVNRVSCLELSTYMRNTLLRDTDCMSMAHSLEVRVPLLDHLVAEAMLSIPGSWKLHDGRPKPLLTACLESRLPAEILYQPKRGFEFPWDAWLRGRLSEEVGATLAEPGPVLESVLHWDLVRSLWNDFLTHRVHWSRVWLFYVLRKWTDRHLAA